MSEETKTDVVKNEGTTTKRSWLTNIVVAVVSVGVGILGTLGVMSQDRVSEITVNAYVHAAAVDYIGTQCEEIAVMVQQADKDVFRGKAQEIVDAIKAKEYLKAISLITEAIKGDTAEKAKAVAEEIKARVENVQEVATLLANKDNEKLRELFPDAVKEAEEYLKK